MSAAFAVGRPGSGLAAPASTPPVVLTNFQLFDGKGAALRGGVRLLIQDGRLKLGGGETSAPGGAKTIDCGGRVLMPGLIDAHWHTMFAAMSVETLLQASIEDILASAKGEAEQTLMRGFTTIRDLGGPSFVLKHAIDAGAAKGPRIYPSGPMITTSGGHGDLRPLSDIPRSPGGPVSQAEKTGGIAIADSADEIRLRVREQFMQGASQIKLVGGGGVSSPRTTLDMLTFSEAELRAAIEATKDRNTYATVHAYPSPVIRRAMAAGAQCIEHGHLMDEATARLMADNGIWLSTQPFVSEEDSLPLTGQSHTNLLQVIGGTNRLYELAKAHRIKTAFGTDILFSAEMTRRQGLMLTHLTRWYEPADILRMATSVNGELMALSGPRNPYPGKLGTIEDGAWADLLVVNGSPLQDISLLARPEQSLALIMKDGVIYKNTLS
ncbi:MULTISPECIES: metal-dependent hydrolase family protein [Phenylobacterium]|uniref:Imidazolonepropionase-like amidohydrolase n=1 Tax=Phenylobacterium koreense TaxID=266125 RepID=A0ABV2EL71_9CAUL